VSCRGVELTANEPEAPERALGALAEEVQPELNGDLRRLPCVVLARFCIADGGLELGEEAETGAPDRRLSELVRELDCLRRGRACRGPLAAVVLRQGQHAEEQR